MAFDTDYGTCKFCGAKKVLNPKTNKVFCSDKCWLKKSTQAQEPVQSTQHPNFPPIDPPASNPALLEALQKISFRLTGLEKSIEKNNWYYDQIMRKLDPQWNSLSQDEINVDEII